MKLKLIALMGLGLTLTFTACKKEDDDKDDETSGSVEGTWKTTAQSVTMTVGGQTVTEDWYADLEACEKDDLIRFNADKTVTSLPGATKCDPSEPDSESAGKWSLSSDKNTLTIIDGDTIPFTVVSLDATTLKLKMTESDQGITSTMNLTLTKQ